MRMNPYPSYDYKYSRSPSPLDTDSNATFFFPRAHERHPVHTKHLRNSKGAFFLFDPTPTFSTVFSTCTVGKLGSSYSYCYIVASPEGCITGNENKGPVISSVKWFNSFSPFVLNKSRTNSVSSSSCSIS